MDPQNRAKFRRGGSGCPSHGLGQAYLDAIPHIKGEYIIMGDADGTYDYKENKKFCQKVR